MTSVKILQLQDTREYKAQSNAAISENLSADSLVSSVIVDVDNG